MKTRRFGLAHGSSEMMRLTGKLAVITTLVTAGVFGLQANASAASNSNDLSSVILSNSLPGLVAVPLGTYNGPITQSNVDTVMGSSTDAASTLGQSLADGAVTAYIRSWGHQPSDGDAVIIAAFEFAKAPDESSFLGGLDAQMQNQSGSVPLAVPGISGAIGSEVHTTTASGSAVTEYVVSFAKGNTIFQVAAASSSGDITSADALSVTESQFANAPDIPAGSGTNWQWRTLPPVGLVLAIAIVVIGRKRKYPTALSGLPPRSDPARNPAPVGPSGPWGAYSSPIEPTSTEQSPKVSAPQ